MAQKRNSTSVEDVSILSSGVKIEGKLYSEGNVRIDGKLIGDIIVNGNLTLGEGSEINGKIKAQNIAVSGKMEGIVTSSEKLILESTAVLKGDIAAKILVIEEGAKFDGKSVMESASKPSTENK